MAKDKETQQSIEKQTLWKCAAQIHTGTKITAKEFIKYATELEAGFNQTEKTEEEEEPLPYTNEKPYWGTCNKCGQRTPYTKYAKCKCGNTDLKLITPDSKEEMETFQKHGMKRTLGPLREK